MGDACSWVYPLCGLRITPCTIDYQPVYSQAWKKNRLTRPAFSLVELLASIGLILILLGLLLPALAQARQQAIRTACLAEIRQMAVRIGLYATDFNDFVPFVFNRDPLTGQWMSLTGDPMHGDWLETSADYWLYPMLDEYGGSFIAPQLRCRADTITVQTAEWVSGLTGTPPEKIGVRLQRAISRSFYYSPSSLREDRGPLGEADHRVARLAEVAFPSSKALLIENTPFHEPGFVPTPDTGIPMPCRYTIAAADTSAAWRSNADAFPGIIQRLPDRPPPRDPAEHDRLQRLMAAFEYTHMGVLGRDW